MDHLAQVLSDPEIERLCDQACDDAFAALHQPSPSDPHTTNVFEASFLKDFEGPIPGQLFIDRGDGKRLRLAYAIFLDFFNPNGTRKRGNHDSVGLISAINVGLLLSLGNKPEYAYVCLLSGPREPSVEQINGYLRIIIDEALIAWECGIHLSSTGTSPEHSRDVDLAFILSINDLPAAHLAVTDKSTKADLVEMLYKWRLTQPLVSSSFTFRPKTVTLKGLRFIQEVIAKTVTPSWINSIPKNYGESNAGTIKADEWRLLATIYIPIALVLMWGDKSPSAHVSHFRNLLMHSMALFQAVTLVCLCSTSHVCATAYRNFMKQWVEELYKLHPHTKFDDRRPNVHAAFHIYDFLLLFGPVLSWWSFPFERLIGMLQKINTNNHIGGKTINCVSILED
ncbi:hypothetical protein MVEN_00032300 [Mycena venus]|uniref:Uncharacterized protein n=1 Tax=Mycena venus TaxID=2733690 RepID=A0A8H7DG06_9AGAR|nr:hypothetical protein MVEN_00032300 [Mycena venus]